MKLFLLLLFVTCFYQGYCSEWKKFARHPRKLSSSFRNDRFNLLPRAIIDKLKAAGQVPSDVSLRPKTAKEISEEEELNTFDLISLINDATDSTELYEGDIHDAAGGMAGANQKIKQGSTNGKRSAVLAREYLWQNKIIPFEITPELASIRSTILEAFALFKSETCLQFVPKTNETIWLKFVKEPGCWSAVGRKFYQPGPQKVSLGVGCEQFGTILHEIMHAVGFWHEHSRFDRDQTIEILWENIIKGKEPNFVKYGQQYMDALGTGYDLESLMQYGKYSFSKNGLPTMSLITDPTRKFGQIFGLSDVDIIRVNALYDCKSTTLNGWSSWSNYSSCSLTCTKTRQRYCTSSDHAKCPGANQYGVAVEGAICPDAECKAPIDGHWGRWSEWEQCSVTCGEGVMVRKRQCDDPPPRNNGTNCVGNGIESTPCTMGSCDRGPYDCDFEQRNTCLWSNSVSNQHQFNWTTDHGTTPSYGTGPSGDHTSGYGYFLYVESSAPAKTGNTAKLISPMMTPLKRCLAVAYHMYGISMGTLELSMKLETGAVTSLFTTKGDKGNSWKHKEVTLDSTSKYQIVITAIRGPSYQSDLAIDDISIKDQECTKAPIDGGWSPWNSWGACSLTCGDGTQQRTRQCTNPPPTNGGKQCLGLGSSTEGCNQRDCPIDGGWGEWRAWTGCSKSCGTGTKSRSRRCNNPHTQFGGKICPGEDEATEKCNTEPCSIDGNWGQWGAWNNCSESCGTGNRSRSRGCDSPSPQYGGKSCPGEGGASEKCNTDPCPIDGIWGVWGAWTDCSKSCGSGSKSKTRNCNNPSPQFGGKLCKGEATLTEQCNENPCSIDGNWGQWGAWSNCTKACGTGSKSKSRDCNNPSPRFGGEACPGEAKVSEKCNTQQCPIDGNWGEWGAWTGCTKSCGTGSKSKSRDCNDPPFQFGGKACQGKAESTENCNINACPIDGNWGQWSAWSGCAKSCGTGSKSRSRLCDKPPSQYGGEECEGEAAESEKCNTEPCLIFDDLGCHRDLFYLHKYQRPFKFLKNLRDQIKWTNLKLTIDECADTAKKSGEKYFAIEYYGECWYGLKEGIDYKRDGKATNCFLGVGAAFSYQAYRWNCK